MAPRPHHWHTLQGSKQEARTAVDFYNRQLGERSLEAFLIHANLAWLYLCHAILERNGVDFRYRLADRRRLERVDGRVKLWELGHCIRHIYPDPNNPVRRNVEFFIPLRNLVEHKFEKALDRVIGGRVQSLLANYEKELVREFGPGEGLSDSLRFPIFLSTLTEDAVAVLKRAKDRLPGAVRSYIAAFDQETPEPVLAHPLFELRILLVPKTGPKSEADVALEFLRVDDLTPEQLEGLKKMEVIVRERQVPVAGLDLFKPSQVVAAVAAEIPWHFNTSLHARCWRYFAVRPDQPTGEPTKTDQRYCVYDRPHGDYLYTRAWVDKLIGHLQDRTGFQDVLGIAHTQRAIA